MKTWEEEIMVSNPYPENILILISKRSKLIEKSFPKLITTDTIEKAILCLDNSVTKKCYRVALKCFRNNKSADEISSEFGYHRPSVVAWCTKFLDGIERAIPFVLNYETYADHTLVRDICYDLNKVFETVHSTNKITLGQIKDRDDLGIPVKYWGPDSTPFDKNLLRQLATMPEKHRRLHYVLGPDHPFWALIKDVWDNREFGVALKEKKKCKS